MILYKVKKRFITVTCNIHFLLHIISYSITTKYQINDSALNITQIDKLVEYINHHGLTNSIESIKKIINNFCVENHISLTQMLCILRLLLSGGQEHTPNVPNLMYALGMDICKQRLTNI